MARAPAGMCEIEIMGLRLLVIEGNTRPTREMHKAVAGHTPSESYAEVLRSLASDATCDLCFPADPGANLPDAAGLEGYDGVVLTGSALNIYNGGPEVQAQLDLARAVFAAGTPFFGSCWGLQVAAAACGGDVVKNPRGREIGIARNIVPTAAGGAHPLLAGRPSAFDAPCSHHDIVAALPCDATILAENAMAPVQAAEIRHDRGTFWGVQYHPEYTLSELAAILQRSIAGLVEQGFFASAAEGHAYCQSLRALDADPERRDIAWQLGIQPDILDAETRLTELRNWLRHSVRPYMAARGRG